MKAVKYTFATILFLISFFLLVGETDELGTLFLIKIIGFVLAYAGYLIVNFDGLASWKR